MYSTEENGGEPEVTEIRPDFDIETQIFLGLFLMSLFAGLVWFLFAGR